MGGRPTSKGEISADEAPAAVHEELLKIRWPREFIVECADGSRERLLRGDGAAVIPPADDPESRGALCTEIPQKHPRNQKQCERYIRFTELRAIHSPDGQRLWPRYNPADAAPRPPPRSSSGSQADSAAH